MNTVINCYKTSYCTTCGKVADEGLNCIQPVFSVCDCWHSCSISSILKKTDLPPDIIKFYFILCYSHNKQQFLFKAALTDWLTGLCGGGLLLSVKMERNILMFGWISGFWGLISVSGCQWWYMEIWLEFKELSSTATWAALDMSRRTGDGHGRLTSGWTSCNTWKGWQALYL